MILCNADFKRLYAPMADLLQPLLGDSLFTANGAPWQQRRRMIDPAFQLARVDLVFPLMLRVGGGGDDLGSLGLFAAAKFDLHGFFCTGTQHHHRHIGASLHRAHHLALAVPPIPADGTHPRSVPQVKVRRRACRKWRTRGGKSLPG